jgi:hypothetical protein
VKEGNDVKTTMSDSATTSIQPPLNQRKDRFTR